jgi:MFS family permease
MAVTAPIEKPVARPISKFAVPFLGFLGGVQGACPNIASTALVGASDSLHMAGSTQALAASMQTLAIAASAITTGLLADRLGRRHVLMIALIVGAIGNLIVLSAPTSSIYMVGMAVTGIGLGTVYGCAFGFMRAVVPPNRMAGAMGLFTAVVMASTVVLTFVGGTLASSNWRVAFVLIPLMCVISLVLTPILLPIMEKSKSEKLDVAGQLLLMVGVVAFLYSVSQFAHSLTAPGTLVPLALGIILLAIFFIHEAKYSGRFYPVSIFRSPVFLAAICAGFIYNFGTAVGFLQLTNLWQYINGLATSKVAIWQLPMLIAGIGAGLVTGKLMVKGMSDRATILSGGVLAAAGFAYLGTFHTASGLLGFLPGLLLVGSGVVVAAVPFGSLILREAPADYLGPVSSSRLTFGQIFYTLGLSLSTVMIDRLTKGGVVDRLESAGVPANQLSTGLDAVTAYASNGTAPSTSVGKEALQYASVSYGNSFATVMFIGGGFMVVASVVAFFLLAGDKGPESVGPPADTVPAPV